MTKLIKDKDNRTIVNAEQASELLENLPDIQRVRGYVWDDKQTEAFADSIKKGYYIPDIVINERKDEYSVSDGQQRLTTFVKLIASGLIPADSVLHATVITEDVNESFSRLNNGITVGAAISSAAGLPAHDTNAIMATASQYMPLVHGLTIASQRKGTAATMAAITYALCISDCQPTADKWTPQSGTKAVYDYIQQFDTRNSSAAGMAKETAHNVTAAASKAASLIEKPSKQRGYIRYMCRTNIIIAALAAIVKGADAFKVCDTIRAEYLEPNTIKDCDVKHGARTIHGTWGTGDKSSGNTSATAARIAALDYAIKVKADADKEARKAAHASATAARKADKAGAKAATAKAEANAAKLTAAKKAAAAE